VVTARARSSISLVDAGLLVLRFGSAASGGFLLVWGGFPHAAVPGITSHPWAITIVIVLMSLTVAGFGTRSAAAVLSVAMAGATVAGLRDGQNLVQEPARAMMFVVLYAAMALTGPGVVSIEGWGESVRARVGIESLHSRVSRTDSGLLVLRLGTGLSLFSFFGFTKIGWVAGLVHAPGPLSSWGFAQLIHSAGLPAPVFLAFCAVLNETVTPVLISAGLFTRVVAAVATIGMAGAMYTSLWLAEEPVRALLYVVAFATLAFTGSGAYRLRWPTASRTVHTP
jgi:uncharacterized membrane protein YphA (DoxX/SURF4 family)